MARLKILLLTPQLPYPPEQGTSLRNFHIIRGLALAHEVHLLSFTEADDAAKGVLHGPLLDLCAQIMTVPAPQRTLWQRVWRLLADSRPDMAHRLQSKLFEDALSETLAAGDFDVVQIEGIELAGTIPLVRRLSPDAIIVFDDHNAEAELQRRMYMIDRAEPRRWIAAVYSLIQWRRLCQFERLACLSADGVSVVSDSDRRHLQQLAPGLDPVVIPNSIDVDAYQDLPQATAAVYQCDLLFVGKMDYRPNVDAVLWFAQEIWPLLRAVHPDLTWAIVGQQPHRRLRWLAGEAGITVTGPVAQIKPYRANARVYVMPFRIGSGTRLKLIEALAAGIATVSTGIGAEGFSLVDGEHLLLEDEPQAFAAAVLRLLDDHEKRRRLEAAGREFAEQYDWRRVVPRFDELYGRLGSV